MGWGGCFTKVSSMHLDFATGAGGGGDLLQETSDEPSQSHRQQNVKNYVADPARAFVQLCHG